MEIETENNNNNNGNEDKGGDKKGINLPNTLITVVVILVIMSGIQVFQTQKLLGAVSNGAIKANAQSQGSSVSLPSQVGGCG